MNEKSKRSNFVIGRWICAAVILFSVGSCSELNKEGSETEQPLDLQKNRQAATIADSAGLWHNQFIDLCLSDAVLMDTILDVHIREGRLINLASRFFSPRLGLSQMEIANGAEEFLNDANGVYYYLDYTDPIRNRIYNKVLESYTVSSDAQEIFDTLDSLMKADKAFINANFDVRAVLDLVEKSVFYWQESEYAKVDPLTPRQRRILNADGEGAIQGALGGMYVGWVGAGVGCVVGGGIGSAWEATFN